MIPQTFFSEMSYEIHPEHFYLHLTQQVLEQSCDILVVVLSKGFWNEQGFLCLVWPLTDFWRMTVRHSKRRLRVKNSPCTRGAEARQWFFFDFSQGNFAEDLEGIWWEFFRTHKIKAQTFQEKTFGAFCVRKLVTRKKVFRANFILQTCQPK